MASMKKLLAVVLALSMMLGVTGAFAEAANTDTPLVYGTAILSQKFSPFYADTSYDQDVVSVVSAALMTNDRQGAVIYNGIEGETHSYNGTDYTYTGIADLSVDIDEAANTTTYTAKLREGVKFSDGVPMTADDIIFNYYVYLDPAYVGSTTLSSYDIVGLKDYMTQTTSDIYNKYDALGAEILNAGIDHVWAETDAWTQEQQDAFWANMKSAWMDDCQDIINYVVNNYNNDDYAAGIGSTAADITATEGLQVAFGLNMWGFADVNADGLLVGSTTGTTWDIANGTYPTVEDYYNETYAKYAGDADAFFGTEAADADAASTTETALSSFITEEGAKEPEMAGGVPNISGIKKVDDYTVTVTTNGFSAPAVYSILGITVAPMHYYGDPAQYDYENNQFGHPYGDLSIVESKTTEPMGAGPYKFVKYENKTVYFEANEYYWDGEAKTKNMQWREGVQADFVPGVATGTLDIAVPSLTGDVVNEIKADNGNDSTSGDVIDMKTVDFLGYGYIGLNADTMLVGTDPSSAESKDLRKAFTTILSVYRDVVINSYYGERASVINYPISNTSWAAPQKTDEDYQVAYSVDVDGNPIYTADMTEDERYAAALKATVGYLKAAGYTFDDATGKFTAAPEGALMDYEIIIPADGQGNHPSFGILTDAKAALETIGITLTINDPADSNQLWDKLDAGTQNMWCAAWGATIDPDMYQVYYSGNIVGLGGSDSNHYHLRDATLDQLILDGRTSADTAFRKATYKAALDVIMDQAVEIPVYQRQEAVIFSAARINLDSLTKDITTFYGWMAEIQNIEMK